MSVTTLFADEGAWVASDRLVYTAEERGALEEALGHVARLRRLAADREAELGAAREAAREEGLAAGREAGRAEVASELGAALDALRDAADRERTAHRDALVTLSLGIVRRLVGELPPAAGLAALARVAAGELVDEARLVLHVHPSRVATLDADLAPGEDGSGATSPDGRRRFPFDALVADPDLGVDDAEIETAGGRIAIDLDTQLDAVREQLATRGDVVQLLEREAS